MNQQMNFRRLIADYIELETGIYIPEVSVDEQGNVKKLVPIRYKNRLKEVMKKQVIYVNNENKTNINCLPCIYTVHRLNPYKIGISKK